MGQSRLELARVELARVVQPVFVSLSRNRVGIAVVTVLALLRAALVRVALVLRQRRQAELLRQAQQQAIHAERDRLEVEVQHRTAGRPAAAGCPHAPVDCSDIGSAFG